MLSIVRVYCIVTICALRLICILTIQGVANHRPEKF